MNKCYNKPKGAFRVKKYSRDGSIPKVKHFISEPVFYNFKKNGFKNSKFYYEEYPYWPYCIYDFYWFLIKNILRFKKWLFKEDFKNMKWFISTIIAIIIWLI